MLCQRLPKGRCALSKALPKDRCALPKDRCALSKALPKAAKVRGSAVKVRGSAVEVRKKIEAPKDSKGHYDVTPLRQSTQSNKMPAKLWNPSRAKNFVKALGGKHTRFDENKEFLAKKAGITVSELVNITDPLTYANMVWGPIRGKAIAKKLLGYHHYQLVSWCYETYEDRKSEWNEMHALVNMAFSVHKQITEMPASTNPEYKALFIDLLVKVNEEASLAAKAFVQHYW